MKTEKENAALMVKDLNGMVWNLTENWKNTRRRGDIIAHLDAAAKLIREEAGLDQPATEEAPAKTPKSEATVIVFREVLLNQETDFSDRVMVPVGSKILVVSAEKGGSGRTRYYLHIQTPEGEQDREWMTIKLLTRSTTTTLPLTARFLNRIAMPGEVSAYIYQV